MNRCNFIPPTAGYAPCSREKGHDGPCAHEYKYGRILCAAIKYDDGEYHPHQPVNIKTGFVVSGYRHCQINISVFTLHGKKPHYEKYAKTAQICLLIESRLPILHTNQDRLVWNYGKIYDVVN
jgi:hypothetical protein